MGVDCVVAVAMHRYIWLDYLVDLAIIIDLACRTKIYLVLNFHTASCSDGQEFDIFHFSFYGRVIHHSCKR